MAATKLIVAYILAMLLVFVTFAYPVRAEEGAQVVQESRPADAGADDDRSPSPLQTKIGQLMSKIKTLETRLDESNRNLKSKVETIVKLKKDVQAKSSIVASLQGKIELLQKKGLPEAKEDLRKRNAPPTESQEQPDQIKEDVAYRANDAEEKIRELDSKVRDFQKISDEQKAQIRRTERALRVAEEEMMKAKLEASSIFKELSEVHGAWLPPWIADRLFNFQSFILTKLNEKWEPVEDFLVEKTKGSKALAAKWAGPFVGAIKASWVPAIKEQWLMTAKYVRAHLRLVRVKALDAYEASRTTIIPHVVKVQGTVNPYYQGVKKFSRPYVEKVATLAKPHVEKARLTLKPYTKKGVHVYRKFLESATTYHRQVQTIVHEKMQNHEFTKHLATNELVWFLASALLVLPVMIVYRILSALFCKRSSRWLRHGQTRQGRRKSRRGH